MNRVRICGVVVALAIASSSALAFQEQGSGSAAPASPEAKSAPSATPGATDPGTAFSAPEVDTNSGTEVRIPGLGKLGVLPKMDFGLELLYGANEGKAQEMQTPDLPQNEDLTIRGSIKHNF